MGDHEDLACNHQSSSKLLHDDLRSYLREVSVSLLPNLICYESRAAGN